MVLCGAAFGITRRNQGGIVLFPQLRQGRSRALARKAPKVQRRQKIGFITNKQHPLGEVFVKQLTERIGADARRFVMRL